MGQQDMRLTAQSADYAALSELSYRRDPETVTSHIDNIDGIRAYDPLQSGSVSTAAGDWRDGANSQQYIQERYGLTIDPVDRGDGLTHFYTDNGFSGFITVREGDPTTTADDQIIVTFRGTDVADDGRGGMTDALGVAAGPLAGAAIRGAANLDWARGAQPTKEEYQRAIEAESGQDFTEFSVVRNDAGEIVNRLVDAGDIYTNGLLGQGTYQETQYDDARAIMEFVNDHVATDGQQVITAGQSLGGGLAALVGVENGLESHTFGMAPFQNQFEVIAQRNAVQSVITDPAFADNFQVLRADMADASLPEQYALERDMARRMSGLQTIEGGHAGVNASRGIRRFNEEFGTEIDRDTIRAFNQRSAGFEQTFEANKSNLTASTVRNEFTTNSGDGSWLGAGVDFGSEQIIPTEDLYTIDIGADQTGHKIQELADAANEDNWINNPLNSIQFGTRIMGEGLTSHSPALNDLLVATEGLDGRQFSEVFRDNEQFRYSLLHRPGLAGGVTGGKVGPDNDISASQSDQPTNETVYRSLSNSVRGDGELYDYTQELFTSINDEGRSAQGAGSDSPADSNLSSGVNQLALQALRSHTTALNPGETLSGEAAQFVGDFQNDGLLTIGLNEIDISDDMNRQRGSDGELLAGNRGLHGYQEIQEAIYNEVRDNLVRPSDTGFFDRENHKIAEVADEITGATLNFEHLGFSEGRLDVPVGSLEVGLLYVQTGPQTGRNWSLENEDITALKGTGDGVAIFMDDGDNVIAGGEAKDYAMLGGGDDLYISTLVGGDLVVGGEGNDTYVPARTVGPIYAVVGENVTRVMRQEDYAASGENQANVTDQLVGVETLRGTAESDLYRVDSIAGNRVIDGLGGNDFVNYTGLDSDFRFSSANVTVDGIEYSSSLSDGENTLYFLNIPDENIQNIRPLSNEDLMQRFSAADGAVRAGLDPSEISLTNAAEILRDEIPDVQAAFAEREQSGEITEDELALGRVLDSALPVSLIKTLHENGTESLDLADRPMDSPPARVNSILGACEYTFANCGYSYDALRENFETETARQASQQTAQNTAQNDASPTAEFEQDMEYSV